jgi:O-antigen biosynthesis protein
MAKNNKKIFFCPGAYDGCYLYRGYYPGVYGEQLVADDFIGKKFIAEKMRDKALEADIIVMQRPNEPVRVVLAELLKERGKKIIFDNDDTYLPDVGVPLRMLANDKQREIAKRMNLYLYKVIGFSDGVTTSTDFLAEEYKRFFPKKKIIVTKNCIDPSDEFPLAPNTTGKFRILIVGSVASNDDYLHIMNDLRELDKRDDITIVVFGIKQIDGKVLGSYSEDYKFWSSLKNIEWQTYVPVNEYMFTIAKLAPDLVIIPRKDSYFNRCKSNIKFLESSLLRIPVLAQGFRDGKSPYQGVEDSKYMTIVIDNNEWYNKIIEIKDNYPKFKELANQAHDYTVKNYNIKEYAKEWINIIKKLAK